MGPEVVCGVREFDVGRSGVPTVPGDIVIGELQNSYKPVTSLGPCRSVQLQIHDMAVTFQIVAVTCGGHVWIGGSIRK